MKKLLLLFLAGMAAAAGFAVAMLSPVDTKQARPVFFNVSPGESLHKVSADLHQLGLIRNPKLFVAMGKVRGVASDLKAGPYRARTDEWAWTILDRMVHGDVRDTTVTIREGLWITEVSEVLGPFVAGGADSLLFVAQSGDLAASRGLDGLEGYLFPSTYRIIPGIDPRLVLEQMVDTFEEIWEKDLQARAEALGRTKEEVVTLASIVEAEAQVGSERPRIAAVYLNRLAKGMKLQADPTVLYGLGERKTRTLYADLESSSPYNTYRFEGLPPGPIGNPGLASLKAALWPDPDCEDLFFVARGDGSHLFGKTFKDHKENRRRVRREREARP